MLIKLFRIGSRILAWLSAVVFLLILFAVLLLTNLNSFTPSLIEYVAATQGTDLKLGFVRAGWVDQNAVIRIDELEIERETHKELIELKADQVEVQISLPWFGQNWEIRKFEIVRPKVATHRFETKDTRPIQTQFDFNNAGMLPAGLGFLSSVRQIDVEDGEYEFRFDRSANPVDFTGGFSVEGQSAQDLSFVSVNMTSNEHSEMLVTLNIAKSKRENGEEATDLELIAKSAEIARLAPIFGNIPRISALNLASLDTRINANADAHWTGNELGSINFSLEAIDPRLNGTIVDTNGLNFTADGRMNFDSSGTPRVDVDFALESLDLRAALDQIPGAFTPKFYKHANERIDSFWLTEMRGKFSGTPDDFRKQGDWQLEADAKLKNITYRFGEKWPALKNGAGTINVSGKSVVVTGSHGSIYGHPLESLEAGIENIAIADPIMKVGARIDLPLKVATDLFGKDGIVSPGKLNWIAGGEGEGKVFVAIDVPLRRGKEFDVVGDIKFVDAELATSFGIDVTNTTGELIFGRYGITSGDVSGKMLGGSFNSQFTGSGTTGNFTATGQASGLAKPDALDVILGKSAASRLSGKLDWKADFVFASDRNEINISSSLHDVISTLPEPVRKGAGIDMPLNIGIQTKGKKERNIDVSLGPAAKASLVATLKDQKWRTKTGTVSVGLPLPKGTGTTGVIASVDGPQSTLPIGEGAPGIVLTVNLPQLDYDAWSKMRIESEDRGEFEMSSALNRIVIKANELTIPGGYELRNADVVAEKKPTHWEVELSSDTLTGNAQYKSTEFIHEGESTFLNIDLSKCHIDPSGKKKTSKPTDPARLPKIKFRCADTRYGQYLLGASAIDGRPEAKSWHISRASFNKPHFTLQANGDWYYDQTSKLAFKLNSLDFGLTLEDFGYPDRINRGNTKLSGEIEWSAALTRWDTKLVDGSVEFNSRAGSILNKSTNDDALKLIGALNYDILFRKFSHDITDVLVEDGILYETMTGTAKLEKGVFDVEGIFLEGPTMSMVMTGTSDWNTRQHQITMGVEPQIRNSLTTLAAVLINPVTGALVYVGGKLAEEMDIRFSYRYDVTGPWDNPVVKPKGS